MEPHSYDIPDDERLWRRLNRPEWIVTNPDGTRRISSVAFKDNTGDEGRVSVHIASLTTIERVFQVWPPISGVAEITAGVPRSLGHTVIHDPLEDDESHALICPPKVYGSKREKTDAKKMAQAACLIDHP